MSDGVTQLNLRAMRKREVQIAESLVLSRIREPKSDAARRSATYWSYSFVPNARGSTW
jgi:hypothetical protein